MLHASQTKSLCSRRYSVEIFSSEKMASYLRLKSKYCCSTHTIIFSYVRKIDYFIVSTTPKTCSYVHNKGQNFMNRWMYRLLSVKMFGFYFMRIKYYFFFSEHSHKKRGEKYFNEIPQQLTTRVDGFYFAVIIQKGPFRIFLLKYFIAYFFIVKLFNYI